MVHIERSTHTYYKKYDKYYKNFHGLSIIGIRHNIMSDDCQIKNCHTSHYFNFFVYKKINTAIATLLALNRGDCMSGLKGQKWAKEKKEQKEQISARLPKKIKMRVEKLAETHKRTESQVIALCIEYALNEYDRGKQVLV